MIILAYHGNIGIGPAFLKLAGGIAIAGFVIGAFILSRKSRQPVTPVASSVPPPLPPVPPPLPR
jgi:hypothetical protein